MREESQAVEFTLHMRGILQLLKESEESDLVQAALEEDYSYNAA